MTEIVKQDDTQEEVSLNAGLELDGGEQEPSQEVLFGEVVPGEVPDLREDVHLIATLESRLQDLAYLREDLLRSRGMCQQFALEGERLLPGFGGVPMGYYTAAPSATRYRLSLEEISRGIWAVIAAAVAAIIAALVKIFLWWRSTKEDPRKAAADKAAAVKQNEKQLIKTKEKVADLTQTLQSGEVVTLDAKGEPDKRVTMSSLMDDVWDNEMRYRQVTQFLGNPKPVYHDIISQGPYTKAFRELVPVFNNLADLLRTKVAAIAQVSEMDRHSFLAADEVTNRRVLDVVGKPIPLHFQGHSKTMDEVAQDLAGLRSGLTGNHARPLNLDQLVDSVIDAYHSSEVGKFFEAQAKILDVLQDLHVEMEKLRKLAGNFSTDGTVEHNSSAVAALLRQTIVAVTHDINGYHRLFAELSHYGVDLEQLATDTVGIAQEVENQLFAMARKGQIKLPEAWKTRAKKDRAAALERLFKAAKP